MFRGIVSGIVFSLIALGSVGAATIYVPDDYPAIQDAINASVNGDEIIVRPGTYVENIDFVGKAITVKSELGAEVTTIDGSSPANPVLGSVVLFGTGEQSDSVLEGFTLINGTGTVIVSPSLPGGYCGGGVNCFGSSPTITRNVIIGNSADYGGGIYCDSTSAIIVNNNITRNDSNDYGGGIFCYGASFQAFTNNTISENLASKGGGIYCFSSSPTITNSVIWGNTASTGGGGIGCSSSSTLTVTNTILWDNNSPTGKEITVAGSITISFSDVEGGQASCHVYSGGTLNWGAGMIDADPLFADSANDDFHLTWFSPCSNAGDNSAVTELYDFEGDPRIWDGTVDMGADEFHTHLYHLGTVTPGGKIQVKVVGDPGVTPVTLALGFGIQDPPQSTPYGDLYLILPPLQKFNLGSIPSTGVLVKPAIVPTSWQAGDEYPFQALLGPLAPGSVLSNLITLTVE